jgi:hypothetical protein
LQFEGYNWNSNKTQKVCHLSYAKIQGRNNLIRHFKQKGLFEKMAQYDKRFYPLILPNEDLDQLIF